MSEELLTCIKGASVGSCYRSDHSPVQVEFRTDAMSKGKPFWKFNNSLLKDKCHIDEVKKVILDVKKQYVCTTDPDNVCKVPNEELKLTISDQLFYEMLLLEIKGETISYASFKKKMERGKEEMLLKEINTLQKNVTDDNVKLLRGQVKSITGNQGHKNPGYGSEIKS